MVLYGVSVGAGDPQDITVKALRIIEKCRVIAVPVTKSGRSLALEIAEKAADLSGKEIIRLEMPMTHDESVLSAAHEAAAEKLCSVLKTENAAMLCLGDVALYSTFSYVAAKVKERGYEVRCAAGVCSPCAAADALCEPLVLGREPLMILPYGAERFTELIKIPCRKVIMKSGGSGKEVKKLLRENGMLEGAFAAENCGMSGEAFYRGEDIPDETGYFTVYIV